MTATPHSLRGLDTLEAMNADPMNWKPCPIEWFWALRMVPTEEQCATCNGAGKLDADDKPAWGRYGNIKTCGACKGARKVIVLREREVRVGRLLWPDGTTYPSRFGGDGRYCCELCSKTIKETWTIAMLGTTRDGKPIGLFAGLDCAKKLWGVSVSQDYRMASRESGEVYRDTNRQTEEQREAAIAKKTAKAAALAAALAAGDPLGREIDEQAKPKSGALKAIADAELARLGLKTIGRFGVSEDTQKNMSRLCITLDRRNETGGNLQLEFKITLKGGAVLAQNWSDNPPIWQDKTAKNAADALKVAIAALHAKLEAQ